MTRVGRAVIVMLAAFALIAISACAAIPSPLPEPSPAAEREPVPLTVFVDDPCGGCGAEGRGCGDCENILRVHGAVKLQLGDSLYDGTFDYSMLNTQRSDLFQRYLGMAEDFGIPDELRNSLPAVFIGADGHGVYLMGEDAISLLEALAERFLAGEDPAALQAELLAGY